MGGLLSFLEDLGPGRWALASKNLDIRLTCLMEDRVGVIGVVSLHFHAGQSFLSTFLSSFATNK